MEEKTLIDIAVRKIRELFGEEYIRSTNGGRCSSRGMIDDNTFMFFVAFKGSRDLPNRKANDHGWVVYAKVLIDKTTGEIKDLDYALE